MEEDIWEEINELKAVNEEVKRDIEKLKSECASIQQYFKYLSDPIEACNGVPETSSEQIKIFNIFQTVKMINKIVAQEKAETWRNEIFGDSEEEESRGEVKGEVRETRVQTGITKNPFKKRPKSLTSQNQIKQNETQRLQPNDKGLSIKNENPEHNEQQMEMFEKEQETKYKTEYVEPSLDDLSDTLNQSTSNNQRASIQNNIHKQYQPQQQPTSSTNDSVLKTKKKPRTKVKKGKKDKFQFDPKDKEGFQKSLTKKRKGKPSLDKYDNLKKKAKFDLVPSEKIIANLPANSTKTAPKNLENVESDNEVECLFSIVSLAHSKRKAKHVPTKPEYSKSSINHGSNIDIAAIREEVIQPVTTQSLASNMPMLQQKTLQKKNQLKGSQQKISNPGISAIEQSVDNSIQLNQNVQSQIQLHLQEPKNQNNIYPRKPERLMLSPSPNPDDLTNKPIPVHSQQHSGQKTHNKVFATHVQSTTDCDKFVKLYRTQKELEDKCIKSKPKTIEQKSEFGGQQICKKVCSIIRPSIEKQKMTLKLVSQPNNLSVSATRSKEHTDEQLNEGDIRNIKKENKDTNNVEPSQNQHMKLGSQNIGKQLVDTSQQNPLLHSSSNRKQKRRNRCKQCNACKLPDCGQCRNCMDMFKFGGKGNLRQACSVRTCMNACITRQTAKKAVINARQKKHSLPTKPLKNGLTHQFLATKTGPCQLQQERKAFQVGEIF